MSRPIVLRVEVHCDRCMISHTQFKPPYSPIVYVPFTDTDLAESIEVAKSHLPRLGWETIDGARLCPTCAEKTRTPSCPVDECDYIGATAYCPHHGCEMPDDPRYPYG